MFTHKLCIKETLYLTIHLAQRELLCSQIPAVQAIKILCCNFTDREGVSLQLDRFEGAAMKGQALAPFNWLFVPYDK